MAFMNTGNYTALLRTRAVLLLCCLLCSTSVLTQEYLFDTQIINIEDGLPHRNTYNIIQDKEGFIWVSTLAGISRYDGYHFKTYSNTDLNIPETETAQHIATDAEKRLWYATGGYYRKAFSSGVIDTRSNRFYTMETISNGLFTSEEVVYIGNSATGPDTVLIITKSGIIYEYDGHFKEIYRAADPLEDLVECEVMPDGSYWIAHGRKLIHIKDGKLLNSMAFDFRIKRIIPSFPDPILQFPDAPTNEYWKLEKDTIVPFAPKGHDPKDITALFLVHKDYSCFTINNTLLVQDKQGNILYKFDQFKSLNKTWKPSCQATFLDQQNTLWAATGNGILKMTVKKNPFKNPGLKESVRGIYRDGEKLWLGGYTQIKNDKDTTLSWQHRIKFTNTFYKDLRDQLWAATESKLVTSISVQDHYKQYTFDIKLSPQLIFQNAITKTYWLGTDKGLYRFNKETGTITPLPLLKNADKAYVRQFYQNATGIWIMTSKGVFLMDAEKETIVKRYSKADGLPADNIIYMHEDKQKIYWLGTKGSGLIRWDIQRNTFRQYDQSDGLSNNTIYAVYEDDFETLWLPSNYGLMNFDKTTATTKVYLPQNGIPHEEFNTYSHFRDSDGTFYFGGLNGVIRFHPATLWEERTASPELYATKAGILEAGAETLTDITGSYNTTKAINLHPGDRILEIELALLDYENTTKKRYAYKLAGLQERWIYTTDNKIAIINPPYGRYDLIIKARGASGQWSEKQLTIPLHIKAPFYLQWWFIITAILLVAGIVFAAVRWRIQKLRNDRKRLEKEVQRRTQKIAEQAKALQALDKAKTRFFANITHEFRTPLTLVTGPVRQLIEKPPSPGILKRTLSGVLKNAEHLLGLINQLLDISKLESNKMKIEMSHGDINDYTRKLVHQFWPLADKKGLQLHIVIPPGTWETHFDADKWNKILYNLLSNAIKFTPEGGNITVQLEKIQQPEKDGKDHIRLRVTDTGIGIEHDKLPYIFDRFYQADASATRIQDGTGIGLALVKELVELQQGTIRVESSPGQGTAFTVTLPVVREIPVTIPSVAAPEVEIPDHLTTVPESEVLSPDNTQERSSAGKPELLIVEDNAEMRAYIRSCIDQTSYTVTEAENGEEGLEKALEKVPDLMISDVMMPKKDGFELTRAIRNHVATSHIPLILLTAKASLENRLKGLERGADAYLTKPFSPEELALRIKKLIELRKRLQQRYQGNELPEDTDEFRREDSFVAALNTYINDHIAEPNLSVEAISAHFSISRAQFYRKLKALINKPIAHYIRSIRLETAISLLKEQQLNITEVAYATGFSSLSHFSKTFKRVYGKSPSEWL